MLPTPYFICNCIKTQETLLKKKAANFFDVSYPISNVFKRLFIGYVIHQHNPLKKQKSQTICSTNFDETDNLVSTRQFADMWK